MNLLDKYEVMRQLSMSESQVNKLFREGILSYIQFSENGKRYVTQETIDAFIAEHIHKGLF